MKIETPSNKTLIFFGIYLFMCMIIFSVLVSFSIKNYSLHDKIFFFIFLIIISVVVIIPLLIMIKSKKAIFEFKKDRIIVYSNNPQNFEKSAEIMSGRDKKIYVRLLNKMEREGNVVYLLSKNKGKIEFMYKDINEIYYVKKLLSFIGNSIDLKIAVKGRIFTLGGIPFKKLNEISNLIGKEARKK